MRVRHGRLIIAAAFAGSILSPALAEPALSPGAPHSAADHFQRLCENEEPFFKAKIAFAEAKLDLQLRQRPSWEGFVLEAHAANRAIRALCKKQQPASGDIVADLDFRERSLGAELETHRAFAAAVKKLIPALSPDQQRVLAESLIRPLPPFPPFGGFPGPHL